MDRFDDGMEEWREDKAHDGDWREERKANYLDAEHKHDRALMFIERERDGGGYSKLLRQARYRIDNGEVFDVDYEIQNIKYGMVRRGECDEQEAKAMFKYAKASLATVVREMILEMPELAEATRIRHCSASQFYPQLVKYEHSAAINVEEGGDFAA